MNAGGGAAPPAYVIFTLTALAGGVQPITRTVPCPGTVAGVGVGVGEAGWLAAVGVAVAVGTAGRVFVAVGVTVDVGVAVFVGVAVLVGVGVEVGVAVAVLVGVGTGVAVLVGVKVAVGAGVGSSNRKFARALDDTGTIPGQFAATTLIVTICPGEPVTVNVPLRFPPVTDAEPDAWPWGDELTVTVPPLHHPLPESVPTTDGAGPDDGLSTSVATWARACWT
jgi:hypothetical protein